MRDDKDHNERLDDFSGYMRQRLEEHRLPVDAGGWDEVCLLYTSPSPRDA